MPKKSRNKQVKKGRKSTASPSKAKRLEHRKKDGKPKDGSSVAATLEDNDEASLPEVLHSKVFTENPQTVKQTSLPVDMDIDEFWKFLFSDRWEGRIRVCEGYLLNKLSETFECFAQKKRIGKTPIVRQFKVPLSSFIAQKAGAEGALDSKYTSKQVVKITFTYYGGKHREVPKQVRFQKIPNSVFTPRLRTLRSILKNCPITKREGFGPLIEETTCFSDDKEEEVSPLQTEDGLQLLEDKLEKSLSIGVSCETPFITDDNEYFKSKVPDDFEEQCLRAIQEFVVVKEQVIKSRIWRTRTEMTFSRKESTWQIFQASVAMDTFYTSHHFLSSLSIICPGNVGFTSA